jgi:flavin-dependent dehydrogenase
MKTDLETEICVIGGGPAGSTIARQLSLLGHDVCLIEREAFPRHHIGESLPASILPILDFLGVREQIEQASFLRPTRSLVRWSHISEQTESDLGEPGFLVNRGQFDHLLLEAARTAGVRIWQPASVLRLLQNQDKKWIVPIRSQDKVYTLQATFIVNATGKSSALFPQKLRYSEPTIALYAYWQNITLQGTETRIEAGSQSWFWGAFLPDRTFNATVFIDSKRGWKNSCVNTETLYRSFLAKSKLLQGCLDGELIGQVCVCDASSYASKNAVDEYSIRVGEAAFSIDPLSSQGVQTALVSALQGSVVVHTILTRPTNTNAAISFYQNWQAETITRHRLWTQQYYQEQDLFPSEAFWQKRLDPSARLPRVQTNSTPMHPICHKDYIQLSSAVRFVPTPIIQGDTIVTKRSLSHPALDRHIAYLGSIEVVPLLALIDFGQTVEEIIQKWSQYISLEMSWRLMHWMWFRGIVVPKFQNSERRLPHHNASLLV